MVPGIVERTAEVPGDIPEGWAHCTLGDISRVVGGGTPTTSDPANFAEEGHAWVTPADLGANDGMYIRRGRRFLTDKGVKGSSATLLPAGTVVFSSRAPIGHVAIAESSLATNQGCRSFICDDGVISEYVYHYLRFARPIAEQIASGTTFLEISGTNAGRIPIPLPPSIEQRRIASRLTEAETTLARSRSKLSRIRDVLTTFRQSVLAAACSGRLTGDWRTSEPQASEAGFSQSSAAAPSVFDLPDVPVSWRLVRLREVTKVIQYGTSVKADSDATSGIPILRMGNIRGGRLNLRDLKFVDPTAGDVARCLAQKGDILFNRTNSPELVGKAAVFDLDMDAAIASYLIRVQIDDALALSRYVCYWINSSWGRSWAAAVKTDGVSQSNINGSKLSALPLPLPPLAEQDEIVRRVESLFRLADAIEARMEAATARVERLSQAILAKAFRGELVPTEAELARREGRSYELASALLERIRDERTRHSRGRAALKDTPTTIR